MVKDYSGKRAIIFDLFGTLTNGQANPEQRIIDTFDLSIDYKTAEEAVCATIFKNYEQYYGKIISDLGLIDSKQTRETLNEIFRKDLDNELVDPGVPNLLRQLKAKYALGVISNIPNPSYDLLTKKGLMDDFSACVYSYEEGLLKPDKTLMELMLSRLDLSPSEVVMVGDSLSSDLGVARNSGVDFILVDKKNMHAEFDGERVTSLNDLKDYFL